VNTAVELFSKILQTAERK